MDSRHRDLVDDVPVPRLKRPRTGTGHRLNEAVAVASLGSQIHRAAKERKSKRAKRKRDEREGTDDDEGEQLEVYDARRAREVVNGGEVVLSRRREDVDDASAVGGGSEPEEGRGNSGPAENGLDDALEEDEESDEDVEMSADGWARLETSGRGLTAMVEAAGVRGIRVEQRFNISLPPTNARVYALVLLYKWGIDRGDSQKWNPSHSSSHSAEETSGGSPDDIMFINQLINSGAATQAVVAALLNIPASIQPKARFDLGEGLSVLRTFIRPMPCMVRGSAVCSSAAVRSAHDRAAAKHRAASLVEVPSEIRPSEDFWMYSVFMPGASGRWVYQMDGCADEPALLGAAEPGADEGNGSSGWIDQAIEPVMKRINECRDHRVRFQLFAIVDNATSEGNAENGIDDRSTDSQDSMHRTGDMNGNGVDVTTDDGKRRTARYVQDLKRRTKRNPDLQSLISTYNYDSFLIEMMKLMASRGDLNTYIDLATANNDVDEDRSPTF